MDIASMEEEELRKLLAYFFIEVRNFYRSRGTMTIEILEASTSVLIERRRRLLTQGGSIYLTSGSVILQQGQSATINVEQGQVFSSTGVYKDFIEIPVSGIDLETIVLVS